MRSTRIGTTGHLVSEPVPVNCPGGWPRAEAPRPLASCPGHGELSGCSPSSSPGALGYHRLPSRALSALGLPSKSHGVASDNRNVSYRLPFRGPGARQHGVGRARPPCRLWEVLLPPSSWWPGGPWLHLSSVLPISTPAPRCLHSVCTLSTSSLALCLSPLCKDTSHIGLGATSS